jgi:hypothetical protein
MYRIIRSIVESSTKIEYPHNQPIRVNEGTVKFIKYRGLRRLWTITVQKFENETGKGYIVDVVEIPVTLTLYTIRIGTTEYGVPVVCGSSFELVIGNNRFTDVYELESVYVTADVPYARPICLADLLQRLLRFIDIAEHYGRCA